jgi:predicted dehydrogenase
MRVAIVGCGLIGRKRAGALCGCELATACDVDAGRAAALCGDYSTDWRETVHRADVDIVLVATTHDLLAPIAAEAAAAGKHVLMEKPGARRAIELDPVIAASQKTGALVRVGFNHRYHRALQKAREIVDSGALGPLMFVRGRYGHGGRIGYEQEWRANAAVSGGGEAIDQGSHLIDLARWFLGDFPHVEGRAPTYFWKMPVEDNAFFLLRTAQGQTAMLHASWTEWKNLFSLEIAGEIGKLEINGLGGSYGTERLTHYAMSAEMGPPETFAWEYPMADNSWEMEFRAFLDDIRLGRKPEPGPEDAQAVLRVIEAVYKERGA